VREKCYIGLPHATTVWLTNTQNGVVLLICVLQALSIPYCQSTWMSVCGYVHIFEAKYLEN